MAPAAVLLLILLGSLALLSQGYALDESCARAPYGTDVFQGLIGSMVEVKQMATLSKASAAVFKEDDHDNTRSVTFKPSAQPPETPLLEQAQARATQLNQLQGQYATMFSKIPWAWTAQAPRNTDRLRIDKLTLYCGDAMLVPFDNRRKWLDTQTNYVFWGTVHNGNPDAKFCGDTKHNMFTMTLEHRVNPPQKLGGESTVILICPKYLAVVPETGKKRTFSIIQAFNERRIAPLMSTDLVVFRTAMTPTLFHEMFHVAFPGSGSSMLPRTGMDEKYGWVLCKDLPFTTALWNPDSLMLYALSLLFRAINNDLCFMNGYLMRRSQLPAPQGPAQQLPAPQQTSMP